ncbi:translation initiation factor IF-1A [Candidatus Pacearchaeota archaeon]|nr:translation initiation factor IF-1A [Candidatus Pacearchaeota archaeon]
MEEQVPTRIRTPRDGQIMGVVEQRLGGNRMDIKCSDGKNRNCRVPGRFKRRFWLRDGDVVLIVPWEDDDTKGDIVFQYRKNEKAQLKKKGMLDFSNEGF